MKKRIVSLLLTLALALVCAAPALAAQGFDVNVMRNAVDIYEMGDDMEGEVSFTIKSLVDNDGLILKCSDGSYQMFLPIVIAVDEGEDYCLAITNMGDSYRYINEVIIKVGDTRYTFTDLDVDRSHSLGEPYIETAKIILDSRTLTVIEDMVKNPDAEVKVRVKGRNASIDFTLSDEIKDGMVHLYNLFAQAGGLRQSNMERIAGIGTPCEIVKW